MKLGTCLSVETRHSKTEQGWLVTFQWSDVRSGVLLACFAQQLLGCATLPAGRQVGPRRWSPVVVELAIGGQQLPAPTEDPHEQGAMGPGGDGEWGLR